MFCSPCHRMDLPSGTQLVGTTMVAACSPSFQPSHRERNPARLALVPVMSCLTRQENCLLHRPATLPPTSGSTTPYSGAIHRSTGAVIIVVAIAMITIMANNVGEIT